MVSPVQLSSFLVPLDTLSRLVSKVQLEDGFHQRLHGWIHCRHHARTSRLIIDITYFCTYPAMTHIRRRCLDKTL